MTSKKDQLVQNILSASESDSALGDIDWDNIISNPDSFEDIMSTIVKSNANKKKVKVSKGEGSQMINFAQGLYSDVPFHRAFAYLIKDDTMRKSAKKIGISPAFVYNLKTQKAHATIELMETIASAYKVHPCFFLEYRYFYILTAVHKFLEAHPETTSSWFSSLSKGGL